ncbi:hypothetical protein BLNAU_22563 [Blattamonas nauphoetae]|uniref:Uncharacterized protein n=1 Tax=Blattamonas nauphoetae TaxID=2049346 RepID=A0ABQ9WWZ0_9EUKA|nr:hypothetical protein BLNAU_22563 [Blattamonas nauphoetae]
MLVPMSLAEQEREAWKGCHWHRIGTWHHKLDERRRNKQGMQKHKDKADVRNGSYDVKRTDEGQNLEDRGQGSCPPRKISFVFLHFI